MTNRIKDLREDHDLTQEQIAKAIGITQRKYSYIETGSQLLTEEILNSLADYDNTSVDYLLCRTDKKEPYPKFIKQKQVPIRNLFLFYII